MPKQTFFNLPERKRQNLIKSAEKEFARAPLAEASIANIVKEACIPRGSFYQYFQDKEDVYFYLLNEQTKERRDFFVSKLEKHDGDIIDAMAEVYHEFLVELPDEEERKFLKNAMLNVTHKMENIFTSIFDTSNDHFKEMIALVNKDRLNIKEDQEVFHIMQIVTAVAFRNFVEKYSRELSDREAIENFTIEMNLIKNGIYKRE
ncbi:TetR/AcrR family transcriptional regulator [Oceanobacillus bengalensis]|uniref:TetR/AcrR family transcriptional regulator n=1 Tax=Oceanobacillus bengalensis TaxID=1435466 RepID=A0A494YSE7_9BACI|nr:TetR family transcriptional regulator [Oceanobacillus bengalensis]RKQ12866.1 TetR/AcrR family transcriptional regulator [Oceanobacillus bengalensis]